MKRSLAPSQEKPDLRFVVRPLPWQWRLWPRLYIEPKDGAKGHWWFQWLFLTVEWWAEPRLGQWFLE